MSKVDIIITTYRNAGKLEICLNTVIERTKFVDYKIYLWANKPNSEIKQIIHDSIFIDNIKFQDHIEPIYNDNNDGSFSSNNNEAAAEGNSEYILFMNDDIEPLNESWLLNMKTVLDTDPKVGAVGALLFYPDRKTVQHCGVMFSSRTNSLPFHMFYRQPVSNFMTVPRYYQAVTAACMLVRRDDFEALGGFSTEFHYGFEDVAFCLDLRHKRDKKCVFQPGAQLIHHEGISGKFKQHPKIKENIKALRDNYGDKYFLDEQFYLSDANFMTYKPKAVAQNEDEEE